VLLAKDIGFLVVIVVIISSTSFNHKFVVLSAFLCFKLSRRAVT